MIQIKLLENIISKRIRDKEIHGIMLMESVARVMAYSTSDLDLFILLSDCVQREFSSETIDGILIEYIYLNSTDALRKLNDNDMEVYHYIDSKILYDNGNKMKELYDYAYLKYDTYKTDVKYKKLIYYWLKSSSIKIKASMDNSNIIKSSFLTATTSWKVLEAIWAINNIPMPPAGSIIPQLNHLKIIPVNNWFQVLFDGDSRQRIISILGIIEWAMPLLQS